MPDLEGELETAQPESGVDPWAIEPTVLPLPPPVPRRLAPPALPDPPAPRPGRAGVAQLLAAGSAGGAAGAALTALLLLTTGVLRDAPGAAVDRVVPAVVPDAGGGPDDGVVAIAHAVLPAIVEIQVRQGDDLAASGSGVVYRSDGHIITNGHVVALGDRYEITAADGSHHPATLVGADDLTDVAVLRVQTALPTAPVGTAATLQIGQLAVAIGSPLGLEGGPSVTVGVISALGRTVQTDRDTNLFEMIQTDAPISPGSSGGALLDASGAVVGITTAVAVSEVGAEGLGFATPVDVAVAVAEEIVTTGTATHPWLGVMGRPIDAETAAQFEVTAGALVGEVTPGSPAAAAGLQPGDVIVAVAGTGVADMDDVAVAVRNHAVGDVVTIELVRSGEHRSVTVMLAERT